MYWNSRLEAEHFRVCERIAKLPDAGRIIDGTGGVGPFAVLLAKTFKQEVICNDLNEHSYKFMVENVKANKVSNLV